MKANAKELFEVMRQVVRDELKKSLPGLIRQHLSETYIRKMVQESNTSPGERVSELLTIRQEEELEEIPSPKKNTDRGIYTDNTNSIRQSKSEVQNEGVKKLKKDLGELAFVLENTSMTEEGDGIPDVPISSMMPDFSRMNQLLEGMNRAAPKAIQPSADAKMRELERRRKELEVPVDRVRNG